MAHIIKQCFLQPFEQSDINHREELLGNTFNNLDNAKHLMELF
jgi:hypothetical protein